MCRAPFRGGPFALECEVEDAGGQIIGPAHSLEEAERLLDQPIDVAILDLNLDDESVWSVARALRDRGAGRLRVASSWLVRSGASRDSISPRIQPMPAWPLG